MIHRKVYIYIYLFSPIFRVILTEHSNCERGYLKDKLMPKLLSYFKEMGLDKVKILVNEVDRDPLVVL